jgi:hypothetical protein
MWAQGILGMVLACALALVALYRKPLPKLFLLVQWLDPIGNAEMQCSCCPAATGWSIVKIANGFNGPAVPGRLSRNQIN